MGLYDRDYYRQEEPTGFRLAAPRTMVATLIWINVIIFLVDWLTPPVVLHIGDGPRAIARSVEDVGNRVQAAERYGGNVKVESHLLGSWLALRSDALYKPWLWWQFLTYGFAHSPIDGPRFLFHIGLNMFALWMFGRDVEAVYGPKEFLRIYLALVVLSGLTWAVFQQLTGGAAPVVGASGAVVGVVILFVLHFPHQQVRLIFPPIAMPTWVFGLIVVGSDLLGILFGIGLKNVAFVAHLAGAGWAFVYFRSGLRLSALTPASWTAPSRWLRRRPKLRVHDPGQQRRLDEEADRVLEKLYREGEGSLTPAERRVLEEYSRRMRQKHS